MKFLLRALLSLPVFFLFFGNSAAQVTKTLNGTVSYRSGMSETKFQTDKGNVVVDLPQSMTGAVITGTVRAEPAGKTEKEKNRNLNELSKLVVLLDGQKLPIKQSPGTFEWLVHQDRPLHTPMELLNVSGQQLDEVYLPAVLPAPAVMNPGSVPHLSTPSSVLVQGDALNLYTNQQFLPGEKFILKDGNGQEFTLSPQCQSAQQAIINVPKEAAPGACTVREARQNQPIGPLNSNQAQFDMVDISLSSPNTNLRQGELSSLQVSLKTGGRGSRAYYFIDMRNLDPNVVKIQGGDLQRIRFPVHDEPLDASAWIWNQSITGVKPGIFSFSASLHEDDHTCTDPFRPQLNTLNSPEAFNAWAHALKKDLADYATMQDNGEMSGMIRANVQRAIDYMPSCSGPEQLEECKAVAYSLLQPVHVPKGAANIWSSGYEAFKSAMKQITESPADRDMMDNGLDYMERQAYKSHDSSLIQDIVAARESVNKFTNDGASVNGISDADLKTINQASARTDQKLMGNPFQAAWTMADLAFSTYCYNKRIQNGIDPMKSMIGCLDPDRKILRVKPEYQQQVLNSLHAVSLGSQTYQVSSLSASGMAVTYNIELKPLLLADVFSGDWWAKYLIEEYIKKDTSRGKIITTHRDSTGTWYIFFKDAKCKQRDYEKGEEFGCHPETVWDPKEEKDKPTGMYEKFSSLPSARCAKGAEFCTEAYVVSSIKYIYQDANCTRLVKIESNYNFSCL